MTDRYMGRYRIPSARLQNFDYGSNGMYFITICTKPRKPFLGSLEQGTLHPTRIGVVAIERWCKIAELYPFVALDAFQLMPDHLHAILGFDKPASGLDSSVVRSADLRSGGNFGPQRANLASVIRGFKGAVKAYATTHGIPFGWQPRYHDRIIRNERQLNATREYIRNNPLKG
ncbi:MAG: hypothetical protein EOO11_07600 [Chitinophagaceae bacterium]|nr:MAG: hypothetical protein EOO11_07600 [Chitinophagaceae bacterium]